MAYRQTIAAHKLIADKDGQVIFLSKECDSNGCIGTVDVSYPSVPLYRLYNPELVEGSCAPYLNLHSFQFGHTILPLMTLDDIHMPVDRCMV